MRGGRRGKSRVVRLSGIGMILKFMVRDPLTRFVKNPWPSYTVGKKSMTRALLQGRSEYGNGNSGTSYAVGKTMLYAYFCLLFLCFCVAL